MKKLTGRILYLLLAVLLFLIAINFKLILYGIGQLKGQLHIINNSQSVTEVLADPQTPDSILYKLKLVQEIRRFAMDSLGLHNSKNYTTYFDQKNKPVMFVVTGCLPYELKAKQWWFPLLGNVSYKGFFIEQKAKEEEHRINSEGYDTDIYSPSAWSTLGYFTDPILSNMLRRGPGRLAELIIHELTHATVYLESSVDFNENFATFVGEQGAQLFLKYKYGESSDELKKYVGFLEDEMEYGKYMLASSNKLDSLYKSFNDEMTVKQKAELKYKSIANIMLNITKLNLNYPERYKFDFVKNPLPNNTEFMAFLRYRKDLVVFDDIFNDKFKSDLHFFIDNVVKNPEILTDTLQ